MIGGICFSLLLAASTLGNRDRMLAVSERNFSVYRSVVSATLGQHGLKTHGFALTPQEERGGNAPIPSQGQGQEVPNLSPAWWKSQSGRPTGCLLDHLGPWIVAML